MRLHRASERRRGGFTLVEVMVVITIIIVLVSLLSSAVLLAINKMDEVKNGKEVSSLASALVQFQTDFNVQKGAPPSRIRLRQNIGSYSTPVDQLDVDSISYLRKVWPRIGQSPNNGQIMWGPNGAGGDYVLEGQQCLVFFAGGQQVQANGLWGCTGFATDPTNPMNTSVATRKGPYFTFDSTRLVPGPGGFLQYLDPYGKQPYAYFSSGKAANGYNAYVLTLGYDCPSLLGSNGQPIQPYYQPPPPTNPNAPLQYYNPDTFQIISAGKNQAFGPGGAWTPNVGSGVGAAGVDDLSNFYNAKLGVTP
jgi:type II secretory pathway pseudopilin PulG